MKSSTATKASAPGRKRNALGKVSEEQIVCTAEEVLKRDGYHALTTRKVAKECGISVGNLAYYFPSKVDLIEALIDHVCDRYAEKRLEFQEQALKNTESGPRNAIEWMLKDAIEPDTSSLFVELWVLAKHHDFAAETVQRFYSTAADGLVNLLAAYYPDANEDALRRAANYLLTLSEGSAALFSSRTNHLEPRDSLTDIALDTVKRMLE